MYKLYNQNDKVIGEGFTIKDAVKSVTKFITNYYASKGVELGKDDENKIILGVGYFPGPNESVSRVCRMQKNMKEILKKEISKINADYPWIKAQE